MGGKLSCAIIAFILNDCLRFYRIIGFQPIEAYEDSFIL